jgi:hypothetical protein
VGPEERSAAQTAAGRLAAKLQAFFDALPEDEKVIMTELVRLAVDRSDVEGYAAGEIERGADQPPEDRQAIESPNPIDEFRANLGLYLRRDN